jgi:hypothetical protein
MIIGIVGFISSGKDTVADMLVPLGFQRESFAKPLKDACSIIFGWDRKQLEGTNKEDRAWREVPDEFWSAKMGKPFTPRLALQLMGTEAGRNVFHHNVWRDSLERRVTSDPSKNFIITDARFNNEIEMLKSIGALVVRIKRGPEPAYFEEALKFNYVRRFVNPDLRLVPERFPTLSPVHQSEWDWIGNKAIDSTLDNNGTLDDLAVKVKEMVDSYSNS